MARTIAPPAPTLALRIDGLSYTARVGWNIGIAAHYDPVAGLRFVAFKAPRTFRLEVYGRTFDVQMQPRGLCTVRPATTALTQYEYPGIGPEDYRAGGAFGIGPCGTSASIDVHDAMMRRCPVAIRDPQTGERVQLGLVDTAGYDLGRHSQLPGYMPNTGKKCPDDQHLIRAFTFGMLHLADPFVRMDLGDLLHDYKLVWLPRVPDICEGPQGQGHGAVGRAWAWGAYLAVLLGDEGYMTQARLVAAHVQSPRTGLLQRLKEGEFWGSPHPWAPVTEGGSGVPHGTDVAQGIECSMHVLVLHALGMERQAWLLADTLLAAPSKKWIAWETGAGVGAHPADPWHAWFAIGRCLKVNARKGRKYAVKWSVPKPDYMGGSAGPYPGIAACRAAHVTWGDGSKNAEVMRWL